MRGEKVYDNMFWAGVSCPRCEGELWHGRNGYLTCCRCAWWGWSPVYGPEN